MDGDRIGRAPAEGGFSGTDQEPKKLTDRRLPYRRPTRKSRLNG